MGMKFLVPLLLALVGLTTFQPMVAEKTELPPMPWEGQLGVIGMLLGLVFFLVTRTGPTIAKNNNETLKQVADSHAQSLEKLGLLQQESNRELREEIRGLRSDYARHADQQLQMLHQNQNAILHGKTHDA